MREADKHSIEMEPLASIDLMERASQAFVSVFMPLYPDKNTGILVCCGTGNNGGDGLAIARLLQEYHYDAITVWIARFSGNESADFSANLARLHNTPVPITEFFPTDELPDISQHVVIDALLGSGLNKPLEGDLLQLVRHINQGQQPIVAVDIPTGLRADGRIPEQEETIYASHVISFQRPKLSFFFPESAKSIDRFQVVDIGLDETFIENLPSDFHLITADDIRQIYRKRKRFSHKGTYGHALLVAGSQNTMGAALLCNGASVYTGAGLTTACIEAEGLLALNTSFPEVMYCTHRDLADRLEQVEAVGIGPGLGVENDLIPLVLQKATTPVVFDADAITFLANQPAYLEKLPSQSILTPHMKEFDRLFGDHNDWWGRVQTARQQAAAYELTIVLKNQYTFIVLPEGKVLINPTGNPAMASGGMGDVLTGMLTAFLAQGYPPQQAAVLACYVHGAAGDRLAAAGMAVVPAGRLIREIPITISDL